VVVGGLEMISRGVCGHLNTEVMEREGWEEENGYARFMIDGEIENQTHRDLFSRQMIAVEEVRACTVH
jgi:hypothetical protein